jgi:hypothetical protein
VSRFVALLIVVCRLALGSGLGVAGLALAFSGDSIPAVIGSVVLFFLGCEALSVAVDAARK